MAGSKATTKPNIVVFWAMMSALPTRRGNTDLS
jgi:hypothetical protein